MSAPQNLRAVGDRIEQLVDEFDATADPQARAIAQELLAAVAELYGGGLERVMQLAGREVPEFAQRLVDDELVGSLLVVHGLHPDDLTTRVERGLESVRPFLAQHNGNVELLDVDASAGAVHLLLRGSADGCQSTTGALRLAVEAAIVEAAPKIATIDVVPSGTGDPGGAGDHSYPIRRGIRSE